MLPTSETAIDRDLDRIGRVLPPPAHVLYGATFERLADVGLIEGVEGPIAMSLARRLVRDRVALAFHPPRLQAWLEEPHALAKARIRPSRRPA